MSESDDDWCYTTDASDHSELPLISSDDDMFNPSLSISDDSDADIMDIELDDNGTSSDTSDTSTPLDETEYETVDNEVIVVSDDDDNIIVLSDDEDEVIVLSDDDDKPSAYRRPVARSRRPPKVIRPMSILSRLSSKYTEEEIVPAGCSSESNGEENSSSSSVKNYLPPNLNTYKLCFDNGFQVDRILGAVYHNKQLLFRIRWRNDKNGGTDYVDAYEMHERCPHMALQFYQEHFKEKKTDKTDK